MKQANFRVPPGGSMIDYYPFLLRAVRSANPADLKGRRAAYVRAWQVITDELRARHPPISVEELQAHRSAFQVAYERIERVYAQGDDAVPRGRDLRPPAVETAVEHHVEAEGQPLSPPSRSRRGLWMAAAAIGVVVAIGAGS